ncbi:hypothetical protein [Sphingobacterium sp. JUb56]|uniref:hypothetical protein n=1 Tax=Sphingobacterium sp. JUb56 TaxID=2587145 RepID=UPI001607E734|nr:hypothetical protein [Sphingobacterium sp. JUb56]MBB2951956.1 biopolymer transport protein ExbB/TolQ [Sphingobacterium sp. JUb56]
MAEEKVVQKKPTFAQVVNHPVTYALLVIVSVFWAVFYLIIDVNKDSRESDRKQADKMLEMQDRLYKQMIEEVKQQVTPAVNKVNEAATKVDSAAVKVDSIAQQQKRKGGKR